MQAVRALLAAKEITIIVSQRRKKTNATRRLWGRVRRMTTFMRAVLTNTKGGACPTRCGGPPSSTTGNSQKRLVVNKFLRKISEAGWSYGKDVPAVTDKRLKLLMN